MSEPISISRLHEVLICDSETGTLTWKIQKGRANAGDIAGCVGARGYLRVCVDGTSVRAHRVVWAMTHGTWPPECDLDHRDENKLNNSISNLRPATRSQNKQNVTNRGTRQRNSRWTAQIKVEGVARHLGVFDTEEEAHDAYRAAKALLHPFWSQR